MRTITDGFLANTLAGITGAVFAFVMPIRYFLVFTGVLVFADLYTGIRASKYNAKKENRTAKLTSEGVFRTLLKTKDYFMAIMLAHGAQLVFVGGVGNINFLNEAVTPSFSWAIAAIICTIEMRSIFENLAVTTGVDLWEKFGEFLTRKLTGIFKSKKNEQSDSDS